MAGLFILLRQLERWLHQHIFKVGWLVTKSFQTTTVLYYTFFLPGVVLHEVSYWLAAGVLNVHAKSSLKWPQAQEIAELDLSFVELARNISPFRLGLITLAPMISGIVAIGFIANNILDFNSFFALLRTGNLGDVSSAIRQLTATPDFWLWTYFLFVIGNTMTPRLRDLRGLRIILAVIGAAAVALILIGVGDVMVLGFLLGPVTDILYVLAGTFVVIILTDLLFVAILGTIEALIERATGDSAVFRRGKLVAMTRQEILQMRQKQSRRDTRALQSRTASRQTGTPTIYNRPLPLPGPPGEEPITQSETLIIESSKEPALSADTAQPARRGPDMIPGAATSTQPLSLSPELPAVTHPATAADENITIGSDAEAGTVEPQDENPSPNMDESIKPGPAPET